MTRKAARAIAKQHRFELVAVTIAGLIVVLWSLVIELRVAALAVPTVCLPGGGALGDQGCRGSVQAMTELVGGEGSRIIAFMSYLPFAVGLLVGSPVVARELELRTAPLTWSLHPSRLHWLGQTLLVVGIPSVAVVALLSLTTGLLEGHRAAVGNSLLEDMSLYGAAIMPRMLGALGVGLLSGTLLGRSLPAFVLASATIAALVLGAGFAHQSWLNAQPPTELSVRSEVDGNTVGIVTRIGWRTPEGTLVALDEALLVAHDAGVPTPDVTDPGDVAAVLWLEDNGYQEVDLGISEANALAWRAFDMRFFAAVAGLTTLAAAFVLQQKRVA